MQEAMRGLVRGIVASHETRTKGVTSIRRDAAAQRERSRRHVQGLETGRREAAQGLHGYLAGGRAVLAKNDALRESRFRSWATEAASGRAQRAARQRAALGESRSALAKATAKSRGGARALVKRLSSTRRAMARGLLEDLAAGRAALEEAGGERRTEVLTWLGDLTRDRVAAAQEWRQMGSVLTERGARVMAQAPSRRKEGKQEARAEARKVIPLEDRLFEYLAAHPDGVRLVEVEKEFGLERFEASRVVRGLISEGKARREDRLYFAA